MADKSQQKKTILCVCLNPVLQKTLVFDRLVKNEVNRCREHRIDASGKGVNVARVLVQCGRRAIQLTQAGGPSRAWFLELCAADGIAVRWVESASEIRFCHTVIDLSDQSATELVEEALPVGSGTGRLVIEAFDRAIQESDALVISGTKAEGFDADLYPTMVRRAREAKKLVVLDIKGDDLLACLSEGPDIVKPNLRELLSTWPLPVGEAEDAPEELLRAHVASLGERLWNDGSCRLVVTRGSHPTWFWDETTLREEPVHQRAALNPTGSGDAFTAGLSAVLLEGGSLRDAVAEGTRLGGLNAERLKPGSLV